MSEADEVPEKPAKSGKKKPLIMALALFLLGAAGGFGMTRMGLLDSILGGGSDESVTVAEDAHGGESGGSTHFASPSSSSFIDIPTVVVSLPRSSGHAHLRFTMKLDVTPAAAEEIAALEPRIIDVLNTYLRAIDASELDQPQALNMIRSHILARMQIVAGSGRVNDVLVQEFVLN